MEHTGGFQEETCHRCHFDNPLDDPAGSLEVEGVPKEYEAGRAYPIRITLTRPGLGRGGFQLAARFTGGENEAVQAGAFRSPDGDVEVVPSPSGVLYARHTRAGAAPSEPNNVEWLLEWEAPEEPSSDVVFHIAANAANYDDSEFGDFIYAEELRSEAPAPSEPEELRGSPGRR